MISAPAGWLLLAGAFPLVAAISTMAMMRVGRRSLGLISTCLGISGMTFGSAIATVLLAGATDAREAAIQQPIWTWLTLDTRQSPSITFGVDATAAKSGLVSVVGTVVLLMVIVQYSRRKSQLSVDFLMTTNLFCVGTILFLLAPNLAQALLGWAIGSLSIAVLFRQSAAERHSASSAMTDERSQLFRLSSDNDASDTNVSRRYERLNSVASACERVFCDFFWIPLSRLFPNWVGEQIEFLEDQSKSIQLLAGTLGAFAILLTWLIGS